jgi:hypothetical protein
VTAIVRVRRVEARLVPHRWRWAEENADAIAAHWRERLAQRPAIFNGRVLMTAETERRGEVLEARFFETDYANLLAWIEGGCPDRSVANGFAMGALLGRDGGFVLGRMAEHTANAGRLYFPCGTPDLSDVTANAEVDLAGSLTREIAEETGLRAADYAVEVQWSIVRAGGLLAFMRLVRLRMSADEARARILAHLARERQPELSEVVIARRPGGPGRGLHAGRRPIFLRDAFAAPTRQP